MLVSETSASKGPIFGPGCGCSLLNHFSKVAIRVRASVASFVDWTFLGGSPRARILGKRSICENSPPYVDRLTFQKGERHSGKWWFPPLFFKTFSGYTPLSIIPVILFLKKKCDFRFARQWPCQIDARSPKWDLKGLRTWGILTFPFFLFLTSGGECAPFPRPVDNSPRQKWAPRLRMSLKP